MFDKKKICNIAHKFIMNSKNMKNNATSKYLTSWNQCPKSNLAITLWADLLMITFEDLVLIFYIWVPNTTIEGTMKKKSNSNNTMLLLLGNWPKKLWF